MIKFIIAYKWNDMDYVEGNFPSFNHMLIRYNKLMAAGKNPSIHSTEENTW